MRKDVERVRHLDAVLKRSGFPAGKTLQHAATMKRHQVLGGIMDARVVAGCLACIADSFQDAGEDRDAVGVLHGAEPAAVHTAIEDGHEVVTDQPAQPRTNLPVHRRRTRRWTGAGSTNGAMFLAVSPFQPPARHNGRWIPVKDNPGSSCHSPARRPRSTPRSVTMAPKSSSARPGIASACGRSSRWNHEGRCTPWSSPLLTGQVKVGGPMSDTVMGRAGGRGSNRWAVEASVRTIHRVDDPVIAAVSASIASCHGVARCTGASGVSLRIGLEAETCAAAYSTALALLARTVLPLLEGSTLMDLNVTVDDTPPGHTVLPVPASVVETAP